ncbi:penicillin-binding transpeptidase domain-containing protein [Methylomonas sp. AM2-LC]|uniref:penicillin-binding transpeptidase domain-containing protein n=1 Tax=Methylomonas sp. AM2-LC TaxID=3153301 RepID=UPI0032657B49
MNYRAHLIFIGLFCIFYFKQSHAIDAIETSEHHDKSCFLLYEFGVGEIIQNPSEACKLRLSPASIFKIPHALAALDSGVITSPEQELEYDGKGNWAYSARRNHTLASAIRNSVVWYFQRIALLLGLEQEKAYLHKFAYGNEDISGGLTSFWLGNSLLITPEEQLIFLKALYQDALPVKKSAMTDVKTVLLQPTNVVVNAAGEQSFAAPWPNDARVSAKTGSINDQFGQGIRWVIGYIHRGEREYIFVSCVVGTPDIYANAAIDQAAKLLHEKGIL